MTCFEVNFVIKIGNLFRQMYPIHKKPLQCISVPLHPHYISGSSEMPKLWWYTYIDGGIRCCPWTLKIAHGLIPSLSTRQRVLCCNPFINPHPRHHFPMTQLRGRGYWCLYCVQYVFLSIPPYHLLSLPFFNLSLSPPSWSNHLPA